MYIMLYVDGFLSYTYNIYAANYRVILEATNWWHKKSACIRAAKKMARRLGIEYREVK